MGLAVILVSFVIPADLIDSPKSRPAFRDEQISRLTQGKIHNLSHS